MKIPDRNQEPVTDGAPTWKIVVLHLGKMGAGPSIALEQARALARRGHEVSVAHSVDAEIASKISDSEMPSFAIRTYKSMAGALLLSGRAVGLGLSLRRMAKRGALDCVVASMGSPWQSIVALMLTRSQASYIASIHDAARHAGDRGKIKSAVSHFEPFLSDGIMCYSEDQARLISGRRRLGSRKLLVATLGSHFSDVSGRPKKALLGRVTIGIIGRIEPYKNIPTGIAAVSILKSSGMDVKLEVHGRGPESLMSELSKMSEHHIEINLGWISDSDLPKLVNRMDVVLIPYGEGTQSGIVELAAQMGTPVVSTPVGGIRTQVEESRAGILAEGCSADQIAVAIQRLLSDSVMYEECSRAGLELHADNLSGWGKFVKAIEEFLENGREK